MKAETNITIDNKIVFPVTKFSNGTVYVTEDALFPVIYITDGKDNVKLEIKLELEMSQGNGYLENIIAKEII